MKIILTRECDVDVYKIRFIASKLNDLLNVNCVTDGSIEPNDIILTFSSRDVDEHKIIKKGNNYIVFINLTDHTEALLVTIHMLGHIFGIEEHCINRCVMNIYYNTLEDDPFCEACYSMIKKFLKRSSIYKKKPFVELLKFNPNNPARFFYIILNHYGFGRD